MLQRTQTHLLTMMLPFINKTRFNSTQHIYLIINSAVSFLVLPYLPTAIVLIALLPQWQHKT